MCLKFLALFAFIESIDGGIVNVNRNDTAGKTDISVLGIKLPSWPIGGPSNRKPTFFNNWLPEFLRPPIDSTTEDPFLSTPELLTKYGYPNDRFEVITADGYIITMFRLVFTNSTRRRPPVLLTHGFAASSADYVLLGPNNALAYLLADAGYDVWILSHRGAPESRNHVSLDSDGLFATSNYWDYSMHEMGVYDLPAVIDHILRFTGAPSLTHVGHSQGSASLMVLLSERPEYNRMINAHIALAPAAFMCHVSQPLLRMSSLPEIIFLYRLFIAIIGPFNMFPSMPSVVRIMVEACTPGTLTYPFCLAILPWVMSYNQPHANMLAMYVGHNPSPASFKQAAHFSQNVNTCGFARYQNWPWSPRVQYPLENINVPMYIFSGTNDARVHPMDVAALTMKLPNVVRNELLPNFAHWDFIIGTEARNLVNLPIINILREIHSK